MKTQALAAHTHILYMERLGCSKLKKCVYVLRSATVPKMNANRIDVFILKRLFCHFSHSGIVLCHIE